MPRPRTLFTGQWADLPLEQMAAMARDMGYEGLELACWGDHFDVARAVREPDYCKGRRAILEGHGLDCWAISNHLVGQCVCDPIDARHKAIVPARVWGGGTGLPPGVIDAEGIRQRAAEEMK